jgi:CRP-like cAMP-binding protein
MTDKLASDDRVCPEFSGSSAGPHPLDRYLRRLSSHSPLTSADRHAILALRAESEQVASHRDIVRPGQLVTKACYVVDGLVGRYDQMRDGQRQITALHLPGDMCDLHSVVLPMARWSLTAVSRVSILRIPHADIQRLADESPSLGLAFWRDTAVDAAIIAKWCANLGRKDAGSRIAHLFCEMGLRMELAGLGTRTDYPFRIIQQDLADVVGITAVHLNRTLQGLRELGAVEFRDGRVTITDWQRLVSRAEFDPSYLAHAASL